MMPTFSKIAAKQSAILLLSCLIAIPAQAGPIEVFSHNAAPQHPRPLQPSPTLQQEADTPKIGAGSLAIMSDDKPIVRWFEAYDQLKFNAKPTATEQVILNRPMNQELARVQQFVKTVSDISKRFRLVAATMRKMKVQENWGQVAQLRDGEADFYDQEASVYEEMIRPRRPSKTMEELDAKLKDLQDHATAAKVYGDTLISMDREMRSTYGVHLDRSKDDIAKYVMGKKKNGNYVFPK